MGMIGLKNVKNGEADNKGQALTGLIAGILTSLGSLIGGVIVIILIAVGAIGAGSGKTEPTSPEPRISRPRTWWFWWPGARWLRRSGTRR